VGAASRSIATFPDGVPRVVQMGKRQKAAIKGNVTGEITPIVKGEEGEG